jgi:outer membrane murein-binding lipoprotein Lpp
MPSSGCYASARRGQAQSGAVRTLSSAVRTLSSAVRTRSGAVRTKMADATRHGLRITKLLPAPPQEVFAAWTDPDCARHWMAPGAMTVAELEMDPRPGGTFRLVMRSERGDIAHIGEYREVDPRLSAGKLSSRSSSTSGATRPSLFSPTKSCPTSIAQTAIARDGPV